MGRINKAIKNVKYGVCAKLIILLLQFLNRTVFIYFLGVTYLGINGLYTEILSLLSLAELGFGAAMNFALYKPTAENNTKKIIQLLDFYKWMYRIIAAAITILGLVLLPFLQYIVNNADMVSLGELRLYFIFFLFNTVIEYFVSYKYSYLNALQNNYVTTKITTITTCLCTIGQFIIIILFKNYLLYLVTNSLLLVISRFIISFYLNKKYPILAKKPKIKLKKSSRQMIFYEVKGLIVHQFSSVAVHSTDSIIISALTTMGVQAVGLISNYTLIINGVLSFVRVAFENIASSFGNIVAEKKIDRFYQVFVVYNFLSSWLFGFLCCSFFILIPPFITLWIGQDMLLDNITFILILINFYFEGMSTSYNYARIAIGNFNVDKIWALAQALVNLVVSIFGAISFGVPGVFLGSVVSRLIYVIFRPKSTFYLLFKRSAKSYYLSYAYGILKLIIASVLIYVFNINFFNEINIINFCLLCILDIVVFNVVFILLSIFTKEFKETYIFVKKIIPDKIKPHSK